MDINYTECFVSSYKPKHQKIFFNAGFRPRGYLPSWKYNYKMEKFEDQIVFNYFKGNIDKNMKIIPETNELLESLKKIVEGLNILNADMRRTHETVNSEVFKQMSGIEKELKSLRKLISEEIVSMEVIKEDIGALKKRIDQIETEQKADIKELSNLITDFIGSIRVFQDRITRYFK